MSRRRRRQTPPACEGNRGCDGNSLCVKLPAVRQLCPATLPQPLADLDLITALLRVPDLPEMVLGHLTGREIRHLVAASGGAWSGAAHRVLAKRVRPTTFCLHRKTNSAVQPVYYARNSAENRQTNEGVGMVLLDERELQLHKIVCLHGGVEQIKRVKYIDFIQETICDEQLFPTLTITCRHVVSNMCGNATYVSNGFILPKTGQIKYKFFTLRNGKMLDLPSTDFFQNNHIFGQLVFTLSQNVTENLKVLTSNMLQSNPSAALFGGVVRGNKLLLPSGCGETQDTILGIRKRKDLVCLAIYEEKNGQQQKNESNNFNAYSMVLSENGQSALKARLRLFKDEIGLREHSLVLRSTCVSRGDDFESQLLAQTFPGVPLVGFSGDGEIGWDSLDDFSSASAKRRKTGKKSFHFYSTIIMILTWGNYISH